MNQAVKPSSFNVVKRRGFYFLKIENETDLHCKVVHLIRNYYLKTLIVTGLGENQDTPSKRIDSWKKGYTKGQPDLMVLNYHKDDNG